MAAVANPYANLQLRIPEYEWEAVRRFTTTFRPEDGSEPNIDQSPFNRYEDSDRPDDGADGAHLGCHIVVPVHGGAGAKRRPSGRVEDIHAMRLPQHLVPYLSTTPQPIALSLGRVARGSSRPEGLEAR